MPTELPPHLDRDTVEQYARESDTLFEFTQETRIGRTDAKRLLHDLGVDAEFRRPADSLVQKSRSSE